MAETILQKSKVSVRQIKAARAMLGWSQADLARESRVSEPTIKRLESHDGDLGGRVDTSEKILVTLENAGVIFLLENGDGPGVKLKSKAAKSDQRTQA